MKMIKRSGGGIGMGITKSGKASWKTEPKPRTVNVATNAQQGAAVSFKKAPLFSGPGYSNQGEGPTGSRSYRNSSTSGPGSQRTIYPKGTQSATPNREIPKGKDILGAYGPERSKG
jgi:hypothetical protein